MEPLTLPRLLGRMWGVAGDVTVALMVFAGAVIVIGFVVDVAPAVVSAARDTVARFQGSAAEPGSGGERGGATGYDDGAGNGDAPPTYSDGGQAHHRRPHHHKAHRCTCGVSP